jgi:hypothetical protein
MKIHPRILHEAWSNMEADKHNPDLTMEQFIIEYVKPVAEKYELYRPEPKGETQDNPMDTEKQKYK